MNVLIVEDDENKALQLENFLRSSFPQMRTSVAKSLQSGLRVLIAGNIDMVILDMTMPTYDIGVEEDGGRPQPLGGREILRQLDRRGIALPVIVFTQFDRFGEGKDALTLAQLDKELRLQHRDNYKGSVYYNPAAEGWKDDLISLIRKISKV